MGASYGFYEMNATEKSSVQAAFDRVAKELGKARQKGLKSTKGTEVDVLIYNCGGGGFGISILDIDPETFKSSFDASCVGALLCSQAVLPGMLASEGSGEFAVKKKGTLIFSSATSAFRGSSGTAQFACGKFALRALSQSIAKEFGKQGIHSVHVRLDCVLDTPGYQKKMPDMYAAHKMGCTDDIAETYFALAQQSPLGWSNEIDIRPFQERSGGFVPVLPH
ncbi:2 [Durusdinium trenchii]|uniref:2 n=1 Tax=Durusdinium trenchii TaxID=1381693 RepID=A0ABP0HMW3_9DINO